MKLELLRTTYTDYSTIGVMLVDDITYTTLEDTEREEKIPGETCIPEGTYNLELRNEGSMTQKYAARYPETHQGMIWLRDVPGFSYVYIHVGNHPKDTEGCILVGMSSGVDNIGSSRHAYEEMYEQIAEAIQSEEGCTITISGPK
jgi:hypothetical protein